MQAAARDENNNKMPNLVDVDDDDDDDDDEHDDDGGDGDDGDDFDDDDNDDNDDNPPPSTNASIITKVRRLVKKIRASGILQDAVCQVVLKGNQLQWWTNEKQVVIQLQPRQLIHDVRTRWDSSYQMLLRASEYSQVCNKSFHPQIDYKCLYM